MSFGKRIETSTYLQIGLAPPLGRAQRGGRGWAPSDDYYSRPRRRRRRSPWAGPLLQEERGGWTGRGVSSHGAKKSHKHRSRSRGRHSSRSRGRKGTAAADGAARAIAAGSRSQSSSRSRSRGGGGQGAETELFRAPNPNKLTVFFSDRTPYLLWRLHTWMEGSHSCGLASLAKLYVDWNPVLKYFLFSDNHSVFSIENLENIKCIQPQN